MMSKYTVLMLTDDSLPYRKLKWALEHKSCRVLGFGPDASWREAVHLREIDLILARIDRETGEELVFLKQVKMRHPQVKVIFCSRDGETAFPLEAYRLAVDDYLFMPCKPTELWRRVVACLKRIPGKAVRQAAPSGYAPLNRAILEKLEGVFHYIRHNLDSSTSALETLIIAPESGLDKKLRGKIQEVSARLEVLQELTEGFLRGLSVVKAATCAMPERESGRLFIRQD